jgi:hypothetical protein
MTDVTDVQPEMAPAAPPEAADTDGKRRRRREKAPKPPKAEKAPKARKVKEPKASRMTARSDLFALNAPTRSRQEIEAEAAAELHAALAPSFQLLRQEVPDAANPDDAQQKISSRLGKAPKDPDAELPKHPVYSGDALVYYQLRRHYGSPHPGGTYHRTWYPY